MYDEAKVVEAISHGLDEFYTRLIASMDKLDVKKVMKRKNPYLYKAKATHSAAEIVDSVFAAYVSSSEETIFGNCIFEPVAIAACGGVKALAEGIDVMVEDDSKKTMTAYAVKSGPSVFNADSRKRQSENFMAAGKLAQQAHLRYIPIIGYGYGKTKKIGKKSKPKIYIELAGQDFWAYITGDIDFYKKIIAYMDGIPDKYIAQFNDSCIKAKNRILREFILNFCDKEGNINWDKLVEFNSGHKESKHGKD